MGSLWLLVLLQACAEKELPEPPVEGDTGASAPVDADEDGWAACGGAGDCADNDAAINPGADEVCDGVDNDCDDALDEGFDVDSDGLADCLDAEDCDGVDNDGDALLDEDFDLDGDGFTTCGGPGVEDCDDDPTSGVWVNPDADEVCDGVDNNCDGEIDEDAAVDAGRWFRDGDGDGFGDPESEVVSCEAPPQHVSDSGDCDDDAFTGGDIHPDADEVCDGVDNDCDDLIDDDDESLDAASTSLFYADGDDDGHGDSDVSLSACDQPEGYVAAGDDCEPEDGEVSPSAREICEDGLDQNCDGEDAACVSLEGELDPAEAAEVVIYSDDTFATFGSGLAPLDWNGDGQLDLAVGSPSSNLGEEASGTTFIFLGPLAAGAHLASETYEAAIYSPDSRDYFGHPRPAPDLNGDGADELFVGCTSCTSWGIIEGGSVSGTSEAADAISVDINCYAILDLGDADDDGDTNWVCSAGASHQLTLHDGLTADVDATISDADRAYAGLDAAGGGDLDGDGVYDLFISQPFLGSSGVSNHGAAHFVAGPVSDMDIADSDAAVYGLESYQEIGYQVAVADLDGDGYQDYLAGSWYDDTAHRNAGAWYGWYGPLSGDSTVDDADFAVFGLEEDHALGRYPARAADLNDDGMDELLFRSITDSAGGYGAGAAWLFYGPFSGTLDLDDAIDDGAYLEGNESDRLGVGGRFTEDLSEAGGAELLLSAGYGVWDGGEQGGAVYLMLAD